MLGSLERWVQHTGQDGQPLRQPDLTVWFDLPPEVAAQRLSQARSPDRFEALPTEFFARVAHGYGQRMAGDPLRFARISANQPVEAVWQEVQSVFRQRGWIA